ncbi:MAG TPA: EamA family transporter [Pseudonocardiaceae bacterium]|jgi:DME family drug/metabolite transporter|nr:EamA family transporter [Pseudonocardiaceae bacterium]
MPTRSSVLPAARQSTTGLPFLVLAGLLWGTGGFSGTLLGHVAGLSPLAIAAYRLAVGGGLIGVVLLATGRRLPRSRAAYLRVGLIGLLTAIYQASYFAAVTLTSVSLATLITIGSSPVIVLAVETITGRRRLDRVVVITLVLALAGLALLVGLPTGAFGTAALLGGAGLAVLSATCFGTMSLACAAPVAGLDELTTTGVGFSIGGALLLCVALPTVGVGFAPTPAALGLVTFLGLVPTAIAYVSYFRGLAAAGPGTAALLALLEPLVGSFLAALFLHDRLGAAGWFGAVLLMVAVALAGRMANRQR